MTTVGDKVLAEAVREGALPDGRRIRVHALVKHLAGNDRPYFALRIDAWRGLREDGASTAEAIELFPDWAPLAALHLSDDEGVPMYAEANSWYHLEIAAGVSKWSGDPTEALGHVASTLRIGEMEANVLLANVREADQTGYSRGHFATYVDAQRPRWLQEARAGVALIKQYSGQGVAPEVDPREVWMNARSIGYMASSNGSHLDRGDRVTDWAVSFNRQDGPRTAWIRVPFHQGSAHKDSPCAADVLESLTLDYETFLGGYTEAKACGITRAEWSQIENEADQMRAFFSTDEMAELLGQRMPEPEPEQLEPDEDMLPGRIGR